MVFFSGEALSLENVVFVVQVVDFAIAIIVFAVTGFRDTKTATVGVGGQFDFGVGIFGKELEEEETFAFAGAKTVVIGYLHLSTDRLQVFEVFGVIGTNEVKAQFKTFEVGWFHVFRDGDVRYGVGFFAFLQCDHVSVSTDFHHGRQTLLALVVGTFGPPGDKTTAMFSAVKNAGEGVFFEHQLTVIALECGQLQDGSLLIVVFESIYRVTGRWPGRQIKGCGATGCKHQHCNHSQALNQPFGKGQKTRGHRHGKRLQKMPFKRIERDTFS